MSFLIKSPLLAPFTQKGAILPLFPRTNLSAKSVAINRACCQQNVHMWVMGLNFQVVDLNVAFIFFVTVVNVPSERAVHRYDKLPLQ